MRKDDHFEHGGGNGDPRLSGSIIVNPHTAALDGVVTATYTGTEQGVSIQWCLNGEPVGTAESGATSTLPTSGRAQGIYTVTASAPGFASLTSAPVFVLDTEGGFNFRRLGDVSVVMGADSPPAELSIPATLGGLTVVAIWDFAFVGNQLTSVTIPAGVTVIGSGAFACNQLTSVTIPAGVTVIEELAFWRNQLTSVAIPAGVIVIEGGAFAVNPDLASIAVAPGNQHFRSIDGVLYDRAGTTLLAWPAGKSPVNIPSGVTGIGNGAFSGNRLESVDILAGVTVIGSSAFAGNRLESVTIPAGVTGIGGSAFEDNEDTLQTVTIPFASVAAADAAWGGEWRNGLPAAFNDPAYSGWRFAE